MSHRPKVLLADDHLMLLDAFQRILESQCEVVGKASDGRKLLEMAPALNPDVVVLDIAMPQLNGLDAGRQLKQLLPEVKLIFLTSNEEPDVAAEAFRAGATGYLLKSSASSELFQAIQSVMTGKRYITPLLTHGLPSNVFLNQHNKTSAGRLTDRQREVLQLLAEGKAMKEAAAILKVTPRTVAFHKYTIMEQHGIKTNAELIQFAVRLGLVASG